MDIKLGGLGACPPGKFLHLYVLNMLFQFIIVLLARGKKIIFTSKWLFYHSFTQSKLGLNRLRLIQLLTVCTPWII